MRNQNGRHGFRFLLTGVLFLVGGLVAAVFTDGADPPGNTGIRDISCYQCHHCKNPTTDDPCLNNCPRHVRQATSDLKTSPEMGPDRVVLDILSNLYEPTIFNHKIHARMAAMGHGCLECHHYSPEGHYPACRTCHSTGISCENLKQVGLKGAYHRQCMRCHREWSGDENCEVCHARKGEKHEVTPKPGKSLRHYPLVKEPGVNVYHSSFLGGSTVTFDHHAHAHDMEIACRTCHHGPGCLPCHAQLTHMPGPSPDAVGCLSCHVKTACTTCHVASPDTRRFDHSRTKFPLKPFHAKIACRRCHTTQARHHSAPTNCRQCHGKDWQPTSFNHRQAGFIMNETHTELDCTECHAGGDFGRPPVCTGCHDDIKYPDSLPGTAIPKSP